MKIAFDINGVLRDTFLKTEQIYQKHYIDEYEENDGISSYDEESGDFVIENSLEKFQYELDLPVKSLENIENHSY